MLIPPKERIVVFTVIIVNGQMEDESPTVSAILEASKLPISIVLVGNGPWDIMEEFDDHLPGSLITFSLLTFNQSEKPDTSPVQDNGRVGVLL